MVTDPMVSIMDNTFDSLNTSCGKLSDDKQLNNISLEGNPWGKVVVPDKEEAIVTLPDEKFIQIINTSTMRAEQKIKVHAVTYKFPLAAAATPIGFLKSSEVKENKIVPSCFIPYNLLLYVSQQYNVLSFPQ
jgi:hypothetical protein